MEQTTILDGYSTLEKGAYLGAIASIATADRTASLEEKDYINALCESANLTEEQTKLIAHIATTQITDEDLNRFLDVLKTSDLRYSLVSDLIAFAQADKNYSEEEKQTVEKISQYLGLNDQQFSVLDEFTKKAVQEAPNHAGSIQSEKTTPQSFLDSLGFGEKLKSAGINSNSLFKGALGIIGPLILARMLSGRRRSGGGMFGGLGGLFGGGGLLGGLLGGGRGFGGAGGLLSRILGGRRL
jgi:uncharacterized tellurite resistance protein B-like protein